jgi:hypothetical protein
VHLRAAIRWNYGDDKADKTLFHQQDNRVFNTASSIELIPVGEAEDFVVCKLKRRRT